MSHLMRLQAELTELNGRLDRLRTFLLGDVFRSLPGVEQLRMHRQEAFMTGYRDVLVDRWTAAAESAPTGGPAG